MLKFWLVFSIVAHFQKVVLHFVWISNIIFYL